jgi:hypothetical protein
MSVLPFTVTSHLDSPTGTAGDGTLRGEILAANAVGAGNSANIDFNIEGTGVQTIVLAGIPLPTIDVPTVINGRSQGGVSYTGSPKIAISGVADPNVNGITVDSNAAGSTILTSDVSRHPHQDGHPHVDFPASSPFALACGGTKLIGSGTSRASEDVWNQGDGGTGGGVSNIFDRPTYQSSANVPKSPKGKVGRGVPDVAGDADPRTGYRLVLVGGNKGVIGGTSAVAPLFAGLAALMNQRLASLGKPTVGFLNPLLYQLPSSAAAFHDIVSGNNDIEGLGKYKAGPGWDPCTGLGTPDGAKLLKALGG